MIKQSELNAMSRAQLQGLLKKVQKSLDARSDQAMKRKASEQASKVAKKFGYSLEDLVGAGVASKKRASKSRDPRVGRKIPPKFRNPDNASETWSGRGNKPRWMLAALDRGLTMDDLAIN